MIDGGVIFASRIFNKKIGYYVIKIYYLKESLVYIIYNVQANLNFILPLIFMIVY